MREKKHNLIYQTINTLTGKVYIGRHATNNVNDGYLGSGTDILADIETYGKEIFNRVILFDYDNADEMYKKEIELLTEEFVNRTDTYNITIGGSGGMLGKNHSEAVSRRLSEVNSGLVSVKDANGNHMRVDRNDPRYLSGELVHNTKGTVSVKDAEGNKFKVPVDDPRYLSGELVGMNTGNKRPKETVEKHKQFMKNYWKDYKHSPETINKLSTVNKDKVSVKDQHGNITRVSVEDERIKTGELVYMWVGKIQSEQAKRKISDYKKGNIWITNRELRKTKLIRPEDFINFIDHGWTIERIMYCKSYNQ